MKNKGYFFGNIDPQLKRALRTLLISLIVLALFIPSAIVITDLLNKDASDADTHTYIALYRDGTLIAEEQGNPNTAKDTSLLFIFNGFREGLISVPALPSDLSQKNALTVQIQANGTASEYLCYFSLNEGYSFRADKDGSAYRISQDSASSFLASPYSEFLHEKAIPPTLLTTAGDRVLPKTADWTYSPDGGKTLLPAKSVALSSEILSYDMAGFLGLAFSRNPSECTVKIFESGIEKHSVAPEELSSITVTPGTTLRFTVTATWQESAPDVPFGTLTYEFNVIVRDPTEAFFSASSLTAGDFVALSLTNVSDVSRIQFSCEPSIHMTPRFVMNGTVARTLIPFSTELPKGDYHITVTYGATTHTHTVTIGDAPASSSTVLPEATPSTEKLFGVTATEELLALRLRVGLLPSGDPRFTTPFSSYTKQGAAVGLSFHDSILQAGNDHVFTVPFEEYTFSGSASHAVTAANSGRVILSETSESLGRFVVIDHGLGLRSWYAQLSDVSVRVGDVVITGQAIGRTSICETSAQQHVYLLYTVQSTFVDPSLMEERQIPIVRSKPTDVDSSTGFDT